MFGENNNNVRGKSKVKVVGAYKVIAQNISRYVKFMLGGYKPKVANTPHNEMAVPIFS